MATMLYDADCGFCTRTAHQVHRLGVRTDKQSIQSADLETLGIDPARALREMPFVHDDGTVVFGHHAWAAILLTGPAPMRFLGRLIESRALSPAAGRLYRWISENRERMPGGTPQCSVENRSI